MKTGYALGLFLCFAVLASAGDNKWTSNGPYGGGITTMTIHPQTAGLVFAGGESVVRTDNNGSLWKSFNLGKDVVVRVNPKDPNMIVAAHLAVFQSNDKGQRWKFVSNNKFQGDALIDFEFNPNTPTTLYGVTWDHGVLKSLDGGKSWQPKNAGLSYKHCNGCYDTPRIEVDPSNGNTLYVLLPSRKVFKSVNGGDSWQSASNGLNLANMVAALAIDPSNPKILYAGGDDGIFKTTDGAATWVSTNCHCQATDVAVDAANPQSVYVAYLGIVRSNDGGKTWKQIYLPAPAGYLATVAALRNQVFAGTLGGGIFRSVNGGTAWTAVNNGVNSLNAIHLTATAQRAGLMFTDGNGVLYRSINGGNTWDIPKSAAPLNGNEVRIHPLNANLVVAASCCCAPAISINGGSTWRCNQNFEFSSYNVVLDPRSQQILYLTSHEQGVAKSTDQGHSVKLVNSGLTDLSVTSIAISPSDSNTLFVGTSSGKVFKTTSGASSWTTSSNGLVGNAPIIAIVVDPGNPSIVYCLTDYQGKGVYKSTNGGQSWILKSKGLPTGQTSLNMHPTNSSILLSGGYGGAYITTDAAESWSLFDTNGLEPFVVFNLLVSPLDPNTYYAATQWGVYSYKKTVKPGGPSIDQVTPAAAKPGTVITINGSNFGSTQGNSKVSFGNLNASSVEFWSNSSIRLRVPSGAQTSSLSVLSGSSSSNGYGFVAPAASGRVTPTTGSPSGGNTITLTVPSNLSGLTEQILIMLGGEVLNDCRAVPPNFIVCTTPPAPAGTGTVDVQVLINQILTLLGTFFYGG